MKMRSYNFCHTNTKNPGNNLGIFCLITGRPKLNGYNYIEPAIKDGIVTLLYPDSPRHPRQKYKLTVKGLALLHNLKMTH